MVKYPRGWCVQPSMSDLQWSMTRLMRLGGYESNRCRIQSEIRIRSSISVRFEIQRQFGVNNCHFDLNSIYFDRKSQFISKKSINFDQFRLSFGINGSDSNWIVTTSSSDCWNRIKKVNLKTIWIRFQTNFGLRSIKSH